jgi:hypothetical protein
MNIIVNKNLYHEISTILTEEKEQCREDFLDDQSCQCGRDFRRFGDYLPHFQAFNSAWTLHVEVYNVFCMTVIMDEEVIAEEHDDPSPGWWQK